MRFEDGRTGKVAATLKIVDAPSFAEAKRSRVMAGPRRRRASSSTSHISLRFGGVEALADISFDVSEHEIRAIIGPNGAGKSSMLNCINGLYQPQEGSIRCAGRPSGT